MYIFFFFNDICSTPPPTNMNNCKYFGGCKTAKVYHCKTCTDFGSPRALKTINLFAVEFNESL